MGAYLEEREIACPYCGELFAVVVDPTSGSHSYVEDCAVCCKPVLITVAVDDDGAVSRIEGVREND